MRGGTNSDQAGPMPPAGRGLYLAAGALFVLALLPRVWRLGAAALWHDEACSALMASAPLGEFLRLLPGDAHPPLYYIILRGWASGFGHSEAALRALSALLGALLAPALLLVGRSVVGRWGAAAAALLAVVPSEHVAMSREARMYTLLPLLAALTLWAAYAAATRNRPWHHLLWGASGAALVWTHYWSGWFVLGVEAGVLALRRQPGYWRWWLLSHLLLVVLVVPLLPLVGQQGGSGIIDWQPRYSLHGGLRAGLLALAGGSVPFLACLVIGLAGLVQAARRAGKAPDVLRTGAFLASVVFVPLVLALLASRIKPCFLPGRYTLVVLPAFCLGTGWLISLLPRPLRFAGAGVLLVTMGMSTAALLARAPRAEERNQAQRLARALRPGDVVVYTSLSYSVLHYYLSRAAVQVEELIYPPGVADHPGWFSDDREMRRPAARAREAGALADRCAEAAGRGATIWVAYDDRLRVNALLETELEGRLERAGGWKAPEDLGICTEFRAYRGRARDLSLGRQEAPAPVACAVHFASRSAASLGPAPGQP